MRIRNKKAISHFKFQIIKCNLLNSKRSQISDTLTWIVATLIIFFIMFFFVAIVSLWAVKEKITFSKLTVEKEAKQLGLEMISTETSLFVLNMPVDYNNENIKIKELIVKWAESGDEKIKTKIEGKIKEKLDGMLDKDKGYLFYVAYSEKDKEIKDGVYGGGLIDIYNAEDFITLDKNFYLYGAAEDAKAALERASVLYLLLNKKVKIKLFIGESKWGE